MKTRKRSSYRSPIVKRPVKMSSRLFSETIRAMVLFFSVLAEWLVMVGAGISVALLLNQVVNGGSSTFLISMAVGMPLIAVLARRFSSFFEDQS